MKLLLLSKVPGLALGAVLLVACGGSSSTDGSGAAAGMGSGGEAAAGSSAGGASNGGASAGGVSNGGASNGGASNGGANNGGTSNGGTSSGNQCTTVSDCTACAYPTAPQKPADCYCASCATTVLSKTTCSANQAAWTAQCSAMPRPCPAIACIAPPIPSCTDQMCVAAPRRLP
jgi:hypothetical protein